MRRPTVGHTKTLLTIEDNEDLLPLGVAHLRCLAEEDLVLVTDKDAIQDKLAEWGVRQVPHGGILADTLQELLPSPFH